MSKKRIKILASVAASVAAIIVLVAVLTWHFTKQPGTIYTFAGRDLAVTLDLIAGTVATKRQEKNVLRANIGIHNNETYEICESKNSELCIKWEKGKKLEISSIKDNCYTMNWTITKYGEKTVENCFSMRESHWYGGAQVFYQYWPIEKWSRKSSAFVAGDSYQGEYGGVLERYFLSSKGVALTVDKHVPLFVSINDSGNTNLCFTGNWKKPYIWLHDDEYPVPILSYKICVRDNVRKMHDFVIKSFFSLPTDIPDKRMFRHPIWSTWAQYKKSINQSIVLEFANQIVSNNFSHSQIEIDDDWTPKYGDLEFNTAKFPNATQMIAELKQKGFRVTVWLHPFQNIDSSSFYNASLSGYLMKDPGGLLPALTSWWDGLAAGILDVTNPNATKWFKSKLNFLKIKHGVDSFKFDGGETNWLPAATKPHKSFSTPEDYARKYCQMAYEADDNRRMQEVRVGAPGTQHLPIFVRMMDKDSNWGYNNGLKTVIPDALTFGILGFPFVLPDMIGGNAYNGSLEGLAYPEKELFIRWMQVNAFLPSWQFSIVPWLYDEEVTQIAHKVLGLRSRYISEIISLAEYATRTGAPIIRPLWWNAPEDEFALTCDDEFLLGDEILVAPVVDKGARKRDIYLPTGTWLDMLRNRTIRGGKWLKDYKIELDELSFFVLKK